MLKKRKKLKILVISAPIGSGHVMVAEAITSELQTKNITVKHLSVFDFIPHLLAQIFLKLYLASLQISPKIYALLYKWGNNNKNSTSSRDYLNAYISKRSTQFICQWQPDIVIATHATAAGIVAQLKKSKQINVFLVGIVTDYVMHNWWYYPEVDEYYLPDINVDKVKFSPQQKIFKWGIPLRKEFSLKVSQNKKTLRTKWQMPENKQICLLFGGGEGLLPMLEIIQVLKNSLPQLLFITVTGKNQKLYQQIQELQAKNIYNYKFVENVAELIELADIVISKAGGVSVTEIITRQVPVIIYQPLPGQESNNAEYLSKEYGVKVVGSSKQLPKEIENLLKTKALCSNKMVNLQSTAMICQRIIHRF